MRFAVAVTASFEKQEGRQRLRGRDPPDPTSVEEASRPDRRRARQCRILGGIAATVALITAATIAGMTLPIFEDSTQVDSLHRHQARLRAERHRLLELAADRPGAAARLAGLEKTIAALADKDVSYDRERAVAALRRAAPGAELHESGAELVLSSGGHQSGVDLESILGKLAAAAPNVRVATAMVSAAQERWVLTLRLRRSAMAPRGSTLEPPDLEPPLLESDRGAELRASIPPLTTEIEQLRASLGPLRHVVVRSKALEQDREDGRAANRLATVAPLFVALSERTSPALELIELACDGKGCRGTLTPSRLQTARGADVIELAELVRVTAKAGSQPGVALTRIGNAWVVGEVHQQTRAPGRQVYVAWFAHLGGLFGVVSGEGHDDHPHR